MLQMPSKVQVSTVPKNKKTCYLKLSSFWSDKSSQNTMVQKVNIIRHNKNDILWWEINKNNSLIIFKWLREHWFDIEWFFYWRLEVVKLVQVESNPMICEIYKHVSNAWHCRIQFKVHIEWCKKSRSPFSIIQRLSCQGHMTVKDKHLPQVFF